jgi:hypothetical protein
MPEPKTRPTDENPLDFLAKLPDENRRTDCLRLLEMMRKASGAKAVMWGPAIVGFGSYELTYADGHTADWPIIGFSPRKNDLTLYIMRGFDGCDDLFSRLGKHKTSKACLYIKRLSDVDESVLKELITEGVRAMAERRTDMKG